MIKLHGCLSPNFLVAQSPTWHLLYGTSPLNTSAIPEVSPLTRRFKSRLGGWATQRKIALIKQSGTRTANRKPWQIGSPGKSEVLGGHACNFPVADSCALPQRFPPYPCFRAPRRPRPIRRGRCA